MTYQLINHQQFQQRKLLHTRSENTLRKSLSKPRNNSDRRPNKVIKIARITKIDGTGTFVILINTLTIR